MSRLHDRRAPLRVRRSALAVAACALTAALLVGAASDRARISSHVTRDQPPPAHTGGFGEATCAHCHFDGDLNGGPGSLRIEGLPAAYVPGRSYTLTVVLAQPDLRVGGFQLAVRQEADGRQAGELAAGGPDPARVAVTTLDSVQYAHHTFAGTDRIAPDTANWSVLWTAPVAVGGNVVVHVVANAADDDASPLGDFIYAINTFAKRAPAAGKNTLFLRRPAP